LKPFIGTKPHPEGAGYYPEDMTKQEFEAWVEKHPDDRTSFLSTLEVGDQIFCNAYLIGTAAFGFAGLGQQAVVAAEFMGVEAVHRALARQSLGKLGNDRVFIRADNREEAPDAPNPGQLGFNHIGSAVTQLQAAGFGFGAKGAEPGSFYSFEEVRRRTPDDPDVNTRFPDQIRA